MVADLQNKIGAKRTN